MILYFPNPFLPPTTNFSSPISILTPHLHHPFIFLNCIILNCQPDHTVSSPLMSRSKQPQQKRQSNDKPNQRYYNYHKKQKEKQPESNHPNRTKGISLKIGKICQSGSQEKNRNVNNITIKRKSAKKNNPDNNAINMKKDLKMLLSKNTQGKTKISVAAPDILKKIEENCRALKNIHIRQHEHSQKRSSKHSKESKSFKHSAANSKSEVMNHKPFTRSKEGQHEQLGILKNNRYSYQIEKNIKGEESKIIKGFGKHQTESKINKNSNLFKQYRKFLQNDELKIEKSSKNTNYNTNPSRNSSSLHNSHGISNVLQTIAKNRKIEERFEKVQSIIKNQQSYFQRSKESKRSIEVQNPQRPDFVFALDGVKEKRKVLDIKYFEINDVFIKTNNPKAQPSQTTQPQPQNLPQQPQPQHLFQRSKYYVQPIPPFKKGPPAQPLEDSLLGCQITLIENNIIDDSELPDLQL